MGDTTFIADYESSSSEYELSDDEQPQRKRRRINRTWFCEVTFESSKEAEEYVQSKNIWSIISSTHTSSGKRVDYRCRAAKYRVSECPAGLYLLYHSENLRVSVYCTTNAHANHVTDPGRGLSTDLKTFIKSKYMDGITKPKALLHLIRDNHMIEPQKSKLVSFLAKLREDTVGSPSISVAELHAWCEQRKRVSDDVDEPYVLASHIQADSCNLDEQDVKFVISTRRLLSLMKKSPLTQTDATYKLLWLGYPVLIVGTTDANHVFHPFAVAVTKGETEHDFAFVFKALHEADLEWTPTFLLADGSEAITNGFTTVFSHSFIRLMCFFHMKKRVETHLRSLPKDGSRECLLSDIQALQICENSDHFQKVSKLFLTKWKKPTTPACVLNFIDYFEKEWLLGLPNWYEGAAPGLPSTNNGLEATNAVIKKEDTLRERLPLGQFLSCVVKMVRNWSKDRDPKSVNCKHFAETATVSLPSWTSAYQWASTNKPVLERDATNCKQYFVTSSTTTATISDRLLAKHERRNGKWKTFDEYKTWRQEMWKVEVHPDQTVTCNCPEHLKRGMCKHSLGMQIRRKDVHVPIEAKNVKLGQKRKRGRPAKARQALFVQ